jgi:hypothetical protein
MPSPKKPCPTCGQPMRAQSQQCRKCKPTYERTPEHRSRMTAATAGKPKPHLRGRQRPDHAETMREFWTLERREAKRQEMLRRNPAARYHGLSASAADRLKKEAGRCHRCGHDGSVSRLEVHHRDRDKRNQEPSNLEVLCHVCHMQDHAAAGETGWHAYHRSRSCCRRGSVRHHRTACS